MIPLFGFCQVFDVGKMTTQLMSKMKPYISENMMRDILLNLSPEYEKLTDFNKYDNYEVWSEITARGLFTVDTVSGFRQIIFRCANNTKNPNERSAYLNVWHTIVNWQESKQITDPTIQGEVIGIQGLEDTFKTKTHAGVGSCKGNPRQDKSPITITKDVVLSVDPTAMSTRDVVLLMEKCARELVRRNL